MLLSSRGIVEGIEFAKNLDLEDSAGLNQAMETQKKTFAGNELAGKTLGIVGLGSIGSMLAQAAHTLGMKLVGYDPYISIEGAWRLPREVEKASQPRYHNCMGNMPPHAVRRSRDRALQRPNAHRSLWCADLPRLPRFAAVAY